MPRRSKTARRRWTASGAESVAAPVVGITLARARRSAGRLCRLPEFRLALGLALAGLGRDQLERLLERHGVDHLLVRKRGVHLAVLHVRAVAPGVERDGLAVLGMLAQDLERPTRAEGLGLLQERHGAVAADVEHALVLGDRLEMTVVAHVRAEAADGGDHLLARLRMGAEVARKREEPQRRLERDRVRR